MGDVIDLHRMRQLGAAAHVGPEVVSTAQALYAQGRLPLQCPICAAGTMTLKPSKRLWPYAECRRCGVQVLVRGELAQEALWHAALRRVAAILAEQAVVATEVAR